jgi:hypothetical protein
MSIELRTRVAAPNTPATDKSLDYIDTADRKWKQIDDNGVKSTFNNDGFHELNNLTNGGFAVQQRVATASTAIPSVSTTTRAGQVADRWAVTTGNTTTTLWQQVDAGTTPETGLTSKFYGKITQNTNAAKFILSQFLSNEDIFHLAGQKVRVSVKIKQFAGSNANYRLGLLQLNASGTIDVCQAFISAIGGASVEPTWGTNLVAINPDASPTGENGTISGAALTIASTANWVRSSCVFTVPSTALNLCVVLYRDTIGAASDALGVAEFQLTQGPDLVDFLPLPREMEFNRCARYFSKSFPPTTVPAAGLTVAAAGTGASSIIGKAAATALAVHIPIVFPIPMFKAPTVTLFTPTTAGSAPFRIDGTGPAIQTAAAQVGLTSQGVQITATGDASGAVGDLVGVHFTADAEYVA